MKNILHIRTHFLHLVLLGIALIITAVVYLPGLHSAFWGDDHINLFGLNQIASDGMAHFIFGGIAGPSGRPLSLLSFALQYPAWPLNSYLFKVVNLVIHLLNGALIYLICGRLVQYLPLRDNEKMLFSLLVPALWLVHPLQVTTVLYVIQRMTQLSAFFTLSGILLYLHYRNLYINGHVRKGLTGMSLAVFFCTLLGVWSKENGILLPLFIIILEATLLRNGDRGQVWRIWSWIFLVSPLLLLGVYLLLNLDSTLLDYQTRHYSVTERLMSQAVVIFDYLAKIFFPYPTAFSIFNDDFPVSTGLLSPPVTLLSLIGIISLCAIAVCYLSQQPVISFAIFWFLGGHLLESTYLSLELYYEHRNYLPLLGACVLIAWCIILLGRKFNWKMCYATAGLCYLLLTAVTALEAASWGNLYLKAVERANLQPKSVRAWSNLMDMYIVMEDYEHFDEVFNQITRNQEHALLLYIKKIHFTGCHFEKAVPDADWDALFDNLDIDEWYARGTIGGLNELVDEVINKECQGINPYKLISLIINLVDRPRFEKYRDMLHELAALVCIHVGDKDCALENINQSIELAANPQRYELKLKIHIALEDIDNAQMTLAAYKNFLKNNPRRMLVYQQSYSELTEQVADLSE
jgi:tetratricopeptide (TPR) repeat protein